MSTLGVADGVPRLAAALERVLREDDRAGRLCHAKTAIAFEDRNGDAVTLDLTGAPPTLVHGAAAADVRITLAPDQLEAFADGRFSVAAAVVRGDVDVSGPVRSYIEVDPILRALLHRTGTTKDTVNATTADVDGHLLAPELLAIETRDLHKRFGHNEVLSGVDLRVPEGVISVVLGPSGTGKSVLLGHIIGLIAPDDGEVLVRSRPLSRMSTSELLDLRLEIGVMYQDGALFSTMNVFDNVAFPLRQHTDLSDAEVHEVVGDQLAQVGLSDSWLRMPGDLSGGMRKRAGLARALVRDPSILICDEPDSGLDPVRTSLLAHLLVDQHARMGGTMLVITHNMQLARTVGDHISVLFGGQILASGLAADVFGSEDPFIRQFVDGATAGPLGMD